MNSTSVIRNTLLERLQTTPLLYAYFTPSTAASYDRDLYDRDFYDAASGRTDEIISHKEMTILTQKEIVLAKLRKSFSCTPRKLKNFAMDFFPVLRWLPKYQCKEYIWGDVMSGLVIGIILVPQAIAYSLLAGLKPIYSLYTSFFANIIYFLMGTSRHVSVAALLDCWTLSNLAICIVVLVTAKELGDRYKHKLKFPLPTELVVIVVATLVSHYGNLNEVYSSSVSGAIPTGFIAPKVPRFDLMIRVAVDALPLAVVSFVFTVSLSEMCAKKYAYTIRANQEMFAVGFCNIIPSFFHSFATSAALAKTLVKTSTGCQTQVSGVISAMVVLLVLLFLAPLFYSLQKCVLACIIIVSLRGALRKFRDVPARYHVNKVDTAVWVVTMSASALISTEIGLLVGIVFSMLCIIVRTQQPRTALLGQIQDTNFYEDDLEYENLSSVPKVKIFRFEAPLYYANRNYFLKSLRKKYEKKEKQHLKKGNQPTVNGLGSRDTTLQLVPKQIDFQALVVDCSSIPFLDTTGVNTLKEILKDYKELNISILLACCNPSVIDSLKRGGYFGKDFGSMQEMLFYSIHNAVRFAKDQKLTADCSV
uniref:Solute carrier family 26 member 1 n=1 Tax=Pavo cristatus TaxID=9049 RepID=A0A8C9EVE7_PAVCR